MAERGRLIALEGGEGCGKSTQASLLADRLGARVTREPGGTELGEQIRSLLLDHSLVGIDPRAEALMMLAARAQHVSEVIEPALASGDWVVVDRFSGSTLAYQGYGRGLDLEELSQVESWAARSRRPDISILLDVPLAAAKKRRGGRPDRLEAEEIEFHRRVEAGYRQLAAVDPQRWAVVSGAGDAEEVAARVLAVVVERVGDPRA